MPVYPLTAARRDLVLAVLTDLARGPARVMSEQQIGHDWAPVTRLTLDRHVPGIGSSVMVKTRRVDGPGHGGPPFLRREAAGLRIASASGVTARLLHFDDAAGVTIQTDVGDWPTLQDRLCGSDPDTAAAGMVQLATSVGRLHASTIGRGADHRRTLDAMAADVRTGSSYVFDADMWDKIEAACGELGLPSARPAREDVVGLFERVDEPGPHAGLIHLDLNPTNVLITDAGARLVDFEGCRFGQIGIDACFLHYPFPHHSKPWGLLPEPVVDAADAAYRAALADGGAENVVADYDRVLADGAAIPLIGRISRMALVAGPDQSAHDSWRRRGQIVQQIRVFRRLAGRAEAMPVFCSWLGTLATAMAERWPDAIDPPPPLFPAFEGRVSSR